MLRGAGEVEVKAVQQLMFQAMRRVDELRSWAQARQWWVEQPPNTLRDWQAAAAKISAIGAVKEMAARVEDLVKTSPQPAFDLIKRLAKLQQKVQRVPSSRIIEVGT